MGLNESKNVTYLSIVNGKIAKNSTALDDKAEEWTTKDGNKKYYRYYKSLSGWITRVSYQPPPESNPQWSPNWVVEMTDGTDGFQLKIPFSSGYALGFFSTLEHINPANEVELIPKMDKSEYMGKMRENRSLFVKQKDNEHASARDGMTLMWRYTKDDPKELPQVEKVEMKGKAPVYNDYERNEFFKQLAEKFNSKAKEVTPTAKPVANQIEDSRLVDILKRQPKPIEKQAPVEEDDDLPF